MNTYEYNHNKSLSQTGILSSSEKHAFEKHAFEM